MKALVSCDWLAGHLGDPDLRVLDCTYTVRAGGPQGFVMEPGREQWERSHVPGSVFVDIDADLSDPTSELRFSMPSPEHFAAAMGELGVGDDCRVVTYDASGSMWAARVWWMLRAFGFDAAGVLDGGWRAWTAAGHPVSADPSVVRRARLTLRPRPGLIASTDEVERAIDSETTCIMNTLDAAQHRGDSNPYGRPGHIPSAVNLPVADLIDPETGAYRRLDELDPLAASRVGARDQRVITYCGGGIAASSAAFVLTLLGYEDVAVYDGSMSEWVLDPSRPLEV